MAVARPRVWVSQPLFDDIVDQLAAHCDVDAVATVTEHAPADVAAALRDADGALVTLNERIGAAELATAPRLRAIANVGVGYNNLDIVALDARGIIATNTPDVLTETTADLGFALLMAAARRITESELWLREGQWKQWSFSTMLGADIHGSTLGILGMGRIGQAIARRGHHGFGMKVLYHNRSRLPEAVEREVGARYVDFDALLAQADHLLLVLPYSPASHHIIDAAALMMISRKADNKLGLYNVEYMRRRSMGKAELSTHSASWRVSIWTYWYRPYRATMKALRRSVEKSRRRSQE